MQATEPFLLLNGLVVVFMTAGWLFLEILAAAAALFALYGALQRPARRDTRWTCIFAILFSLLPLFAVSALASNYLREYWDRAWYLIPGTLIPLVVSFAALYVRHRALRSGRLTITFEDLGYSNTIVIEALIELLTEKGLPSRPELEERARKLKRGTKLDFRGAQR